MQSEFNLKYLMGIRKVEVKDKEERKVKLKLKYYISRILKFC